MAKKGRITVGIDPGKSPMESLESMISFTLGKFNDDTKFAIGNLLDNLGRVLEQQDAIGRFKEPQDVVKFTYDLADNGNGPFAQFDSAINESFAVTSKDIEMAEKIAEDAANFDIDWSEAISDDERYVWICAGVNTCPDCLVRHGEALPMAEWQAKGLPGSGWSVCGEFCQCELEPEYSLKERGIGVASIREPVIQLQRKLADVGTKTGLKIKNITGIIAGKGVDKMMRAYEKKDRDGIPTTDPARIAERRMFRELGKFSEPD